MVSYFLALNPEVQERLYDELTDALDGLDVNSAEYFDKVNSKIPYLDAVIKGKLNFRLTIVVNFIPPQKLFAETLLWPVCKGDAVLIITN